MRTHVGVQEFSSEEGTCFIPEWLMKRLDLSFNSLVSLRYERLSTGTFAVLQAQDPSFLDIGDHKAVLEFHLVKFAALTKNEIISIFHEGVEHQLRIIRIMAEGREVNAACIIDTDLAVDFEAPVGYVEPPPPAAAPVKSRPSKFTFGSKKTDEPEEPEKKERFVGKPRTIKGVSRTGSIPTHINQTIGTPPVKKESSPWVGRARTLAGTKK